MYYAYMCVYNYSNHEDDEDPIVDTVAHSKDTNRSQLLRQFEILGSLIFSKLPPPPLSLSSAPAFFSLFLFHISAFNAE
jgi:hypothetical protein